MVAGVGLHIAAMFPAYPGNPATPVVQTPYEVAVYTCLEVGWALAALLVLTRWSFRGGVALGAGLGVVEVGLIVTDLTIGFQVSDGSAAGIWLAIAGLASGLAGVLYGAGTATMGTDLALAGPEVPPFAHPYSQPPSQAPGSGPGPRPRPAAMSPVRALLSVMVAIVAVAAFWPSWDHYHLVYATGQVRDINLGNAFDQPTAIMAGELVAGLAVGCAVVIAAFWRDALVGAWATVGTAIALASQVISGAVPVSEPISQLLGTSNTAALNLSASSVSLTGYWYVDLGATAALVLLAAWAALEARRARPAPVPATHEGPTAP